MLTTAQIIEIRKYFLPPGDEEQVQAAIDLPIPYPSELLPLLKQIFNSAINDEPGLIDIAKRMDAEENIEEFKTIREDYYTNLALLYNAGTSNPDIEILVANNNPDFKKEIDFQKNLKVAFHLNEFAEFKKGFRDLENKLEANEKSNLPGAPIYTGQFNWKKIAIAATVLGVIATSTFILFQRSRKQEKIANNEKKHISDSIAFLKEKLRKSDSIAFGLERKRLHDSLDQIKTRMNELLAVNTLPHERKHIQILRNYEIEYMPMPKSEKGLPTRGKGIVQRPVNMITQYLLDSLISKIDNEISVAQQNTPEFTPLLNLLIAKKDSISSLENKYSAEGSSLQLYLPKRKTVWVIELNSTNYLQINDSVYEIKKYAHLLPLIKTSDIGIIRKVKSITQNSIVKQRPAK